MLLVLLLKPLCAATCESERLRSLTGGDGAMPNRGWVDVGLSPQLSLAQNILVEKRSAEHKSPIQLIKDKRFFD